MQRCSIGTLRRPPYGSVHAEPAMCGLVMEVIGSSKAIRTFMSRRAVLIHRHADDLPTANRGKNRAFDCGTAELRSGQRGSREGLTQHLGDVLIRGLPPQARHLFHSIQYVVTLERHLQIRILGVWRRDRDSNPG